MILISTFFTRLYVVLLVKVYENKRMKVDLSDLDYLVLAHSLIIVIPAIMCGRFFLIKSISQFNNNTDNEADVNIFI